MTRYPYHILIIRNRLAFPLDIVSGVRKFLAEKTDLDPVIQVMDLDIPLSFEQFTTPDGRELHGLLGIKQLLRDTKKIGANEYNAILFFYDQTLSPEPGKTQGRVYPQDLEGAVFGEIPTQKGLVEVGDTLRMTLHEMMHQFHFRARFKGYPTDDTMDRYDKDFDPYALDGNFARNLKALAPFWRIVADAPLPTPATPLTGPNKPKYIVVHSSDVLSSKSSNQLNGINAYHREQRFPISRLGYHVGYHALLTGGKLVRTREDDEAGAHTSQVVNGVSINFQSLGICIAFDGDLEQIPQAYLPLLKKQIEEWMSKYDIPLVNVVPHRMFTKTRTCPGSLISIEAIHRLIGEPKPKPEEQKEKQEQITQLLGIIAQLKEILRRFQEKVANSNVNR